MGNPTEVTHSFSIKINPTKPTEDKLILPCITITYQLKINFLLLPLKPMASNYPT